MEPSRLGSVGLAFVLALALVAVPRVGRATPTRMGGGCPVVRGLWTGTIEGSITLPSRGARVVVVAFSRTMPGCAYAAMTRPGEDRYVLEHLPDGVWHVVAYARGATAGAERVGAWSDSVACMATCGRSGTCCRAAHHLLLDVTIARGRRVRHVTISDWTAVGAPHATWSPPARPPDVPRP